ncbi:MAG: transglycosylase SLT domain-containing protein [Polyangiaceae bacterium]|nr:transglycosylase SLT domain-containing protein [Polyangiaceae bacterium]
MTDASTPRAPPAARAARRGTWRAWGGIGAAAALAAAVVASCAGSAAHVAGPPRIPLSSTGATSAAAAAAVPIDIGVERFTPLLALPGYEAIGGLADADRAGEAARALERALAERPPAAADVPRWQFALGRLREQAGELAAAAASYELAAAPGFELEAWAWVSAGRTLLRAGRPRDALARFGRARVEGPLTDDARLLEAEAAELAGDRERAMALWRAHLETERPRDHVAVALRLSEALLARGAGAEPGATAPEEALRLARRVRLQTPGESPIAERARKLERRALELLPPARRRQLEPLTPDDRLLHGEALLAAGQHRGAREALEPLLQELGAALRHGELGCRASLVIAKSHVGEGAHGRAVDALLDPLRECGASPEHPRIAFVAAEAAARDGRHAVAAQLYLELERRHPEHSLADDARLRAARSYLALGDEARFTELLSSLASDHPRGDTVLDGVFELALARIDKLDWSGAANVLERVAPLLDGEKDAARGVERSGRERYFRARALYETGDRERALDAFEAMVREVPLSYYMRLAWSRLEAAAPERAARAREAAAERARAAPFSRLTPAEAETPGFRRAMELLRQGDIELGRRELSALGLSSQRAAPELLWTVAMLYARAGSPRLSHGIARGLLTDWLSRWPSGDWAHAWQLAYPRPHLAIVEREARANGVPEALIYAVMREESAFDPNAESPANAHGLMQLIVPTAKLYARGLPYDARALRRPEINVALGCRALAKLRTVFDEPVLAIPAYNAGPGRPRRWLRERPRGDFDVWVERIPITETRRYVKRVLASEAAYSVLYGDGAALALPLRLGPG